MDRTDLKRNQIKQLKDFLPPESCHRILAAEINGTTYHLNEEAQTGIIEWLTLNSEAGARVYQRTLCLILFTAIDELFPSQNIRVLYSISNGFYCEKVTRELFSEAELSQIETRMKEIIRANEPIHIIKMDASEATALFTSKNRMDTVNLINQLNENEITLYQCQNTVEYLYEPVADQTGKTDTFELFSDLDGFLLRFPIVGEEAEIPQFTPLRKLANSFAEAEKWADILNCQFISDLNSYNLAGKFNEIIDLAEAFHTQKIVHIADGITEKAQDARLICIAGPSSSGKTTFANRLKTYLQINGWNPITISIDDYFKNREFSPRNPDGSYDFEHIEAIDLQLFNQHLDELLHGKEVQIPSFNFITGEREWTDKRIKVGLKDFVIIEGIHGLNERLTVSIPRKEKIKIYISALTQLALDNHNRVSTTDTRLIRRLVRDFQFRGASAERTLKMWRSVREGEEKFIFPFQEEADVMFNSTLIYELAVLKHWAVPLLSSVPVESDLHGESQELLKFLSYFIEGEHRLVPKNSLLKEFIGE